VAGPGELDGEPCRAVRAAIRACPCPGGPGRRSRGATSPDPACGPAGALRRNGTQRHASMHGGAVEPARLLFCAPSSVPGSAIIHSKFSHSDITDNRLTTQHCGTACCSWRGQCHNVQATGASAHRCALGSSSWEAVHLARHRSVPAQHADGASTRSRPGWPRGETAGSRPQAPAAPLRVPRLSGRRRGAKPRANFCSRGAKPRKPVPRQAPMGVSQLTVGKSPEGASAEGDVWRWVWADQWSVRVWSRSMLEVCVINEVAPNSTARVPEH